MRIRVSWFFLIAIVVFYLFSSSAWEANYGVVAEGFFVVGLLLAGFGPWADYGARHISPATKTTR